MNQSKFCMRRNYLKASPILLLTASLFFPNTVLSATDTDDDGVTDSSDNCLTISNADQSDAVSAFVLASHHTDYEYTYFHNGSAHKGWQVWIPSDTSKAKIYAGNTLLQGGATIIPKENVSIYDQVAGTDYVWVDHGGVKQSRLWVNHIGKLDGPLTLLLLDDADGHGDKCSPNLGVDFDGIPDGADNCPFDFNPHQVDTFGTSAGDACETDAHLSVNANPTRPDWIYQGTATLYEHTNYTGKSERIWVSDSDLNGNYIGPNTVSSIKVGRHTEIMLYTDKNYLGTSEIFFGDDPDLTANTVGDNSIVSIKLGSAPPIQAHKLTIGIDFWSVSKGHVGHILWSELENLVSDGSGSSITLNHDYIGSVKSIHVSYDGNGDYTVTTTNLDGTNGETAYFHYESVVSYGSERQIPGALVSGGTSSTIDSEVNTDYVHTVSGQSWDGYLNPGVRALFLAVYGSDTSAKAAWEQEAKASS